jgi:RecB family exonuclease
MKINNGPLIIFPTELAKRQFERKEAICRGVLSTAALSTQARLREHLETAARQADLLMERAPGSVEYALLIDQAAETVQMPRSQPLNALSLAARGTLLKQIIERFTFLAEHRDTLIGWLAAHEPSHKLYGIGLLLQAWTGLCRERNIADRFVQNRAILQLVKEGPLPEDILRGIEFRFVRWLNPFEEQLIIALKQRLGDDKVRVHSALPPAHAESTENRMHKTLRSEGLPDTETAWASWKEDLADAFETDDENLLGKEAGEHIHLLVSAHPYGEIEDIARRIAKQIENGTPPDEMALILRNLGPYTDIIPDVFQRFGIPCFFRRGAPAVSDPQVKTLLSLLTLSTGKPPRDRLCDLLTAPSVEWLGLDLEQRQHLAKKLRQEEPPRLHRTPTQLKDLLPPAPEKLTPEEFSTLVLTKAEIHALKLPEEVVRLTEAFSKANLPSGPFSRTLSVFESLLENLTLADPESSEAGVRVINPIDAAGLSFETVFLGGMDSRSFPQPPQPDALLNRSERMALHAFLTERKIPCPRLALSDPAEALIQEEILFLIAQGTARREMTLSYSQSDGSGKEQTPGEFFERIQAITKTANLTHGESFHSILPPDACRAEDEIRQTAAHLGRKPDTEPKSFPKEKVQELFEAWMNPSPEFSATSLESLARNRYLFFVEKVLKISPDRTREDDIDPMDRGSLVHSILEKTYAAVAEQSGLYAKKEADGWVLAQSGEIPLAAFDPNRSDDILSLARKIAEAEFTRTEARPDSRLGHHSVWENEKTKLLRIVENFIRCELESALAETRYPACFELPFGEQSGFPFLLEHNGQPIRLKGKIDRVDLIFDKEGKLEQLLVVDYKGTSKNASLETLEEQIKRNLDCQLALYTFAAQQYFFGAHNTPELNSKTAAVYHIQERDLNKMTSQFKKKRLSFSKELSAEFMQTLFANIQKLREGDLATEPLIAGYDDVSHICRTKAIDPKDLIRKVLQKVE